MKSYYKLISGICYLLALSMVSRAQQAADADPPPAGLYAPSYSSSLYNTSDNIPAFLHESENLDRVTENNWAINSNIIISDQTICANAIPTSLTGSLPTGGNGSFLYQWQSSTTSSTGGFANIVTGTNQHFAPAALTITTWYRRVVVSGAESDTSTSIQIKVKPGTVSVLITNPAPVCAPQTVNLTAPAVTAGSTADLTFAYFTNAAGTITVSNPTSVSASGTKSFYIRGSNGCSSDMKQVTIKVNPQPLVSAIGPPVPVCKGTAVTLVAFSLGNTIAWQDIGPGANIVVTPQETTSYTAIATSPLGCSRSAPPITVQVINFSATLAAAPDPVIAGTPVTLQPSSATNFVAVAWLPQNLFSNQNAQTQSFTIPDTSRNFSVVVRSEDGCLDTASVKVKVAVNTTDVYVPNAFTPNNDGKNDIFKVYGSSIKNIEMRIYDQWGRLIHESNNNMTGWDGMRQQKPMPIGVYMYTVKIRLDNEDSFIKKGTVNLIR